MKKASLALAFSLLMAVTTIAGDIPHIPGPTPKDPCTQNCTSGASAPTEPTLIESVLSAISEAIQAVQASLS